MTHDELRKLAMAATQPSPWTVKRSRHQARDVHMILDANGFWVADCGEAPHDAAFIAAASPSVVLAILDELERLRAENKRLDTAMGRHISEAMRSTEVAVLEQQLAAVTAARDELADMLEPIVNYEMSGTARHEGLKKINALRKVGT